VARVVAIHQPNFLPWLGFFDKMDRGDAFILLDRVQLIRRSYTTRTTVLQGSEPVVLSLPVRHTGTQDLPIGDALLDDAARASRKAATTLRHAYGRFPFWNEVGAPIVAMLERPPDRLLDLNIELLQHLASLLGIPWTKVKRQSELPHVGKKSELMASLTRAVDGDVYLSGGHDPAAHPEIGTAGTGAEYNDEQVYGAHGVELRYQNFVHPTYDQKNAAFVPGLSAVDALVRHGSGVIALLRQANHR